MGVGPCNMKHFVCKRSFMSIVSEAGALNSQDLAGLQENCTNTFTQHQVSSKWASLEFVGSLKSSGSLDHPGFPAKTAFCPVARLQSISARLGGWLMIPLPPGFSD